MQHLALFSEYGRLALSNSTSSNIINSSIGGEEKCLISDDEGDDNVQEENGLDRRHHHQSREENDEQEDVMKRMPSDYRYTTLNMKNKPFQRVQFLVRDWQNFSHDWPTDDADNGQQKQAVYAALRGEMTGYLDSVLKPRGLGDLQSTRDQITRCFESIDCFLLPVSKDKSHRPNE